MIRQWLPRIGVLLAAMVIARVARAVFLTHDVTIGGDGQSFIRYYEEARTSFARGHGFPLWDRGQCGGYPFLANPETGLISALFAAVFRIHGDSMERWVPTLGIVVGVLGTYAWCRRCFALARIPSLYAGAIFMASHFVSGQFASRMAFVPFALIPWALLFAQLGEEDLRAAEGCGVVLALMAIEGGTYPLPYAILAVVVVEGSRVLRKNVGFYRLGRLTMISALVFVLVASVKLYPELVLLAHHGRAVTETDAHGWVDLIPMLIDKDRHGHFPGFVYPWDEYRGYLGPLAVGMGIAGLGVSLVLAPRRWEVPLLFLISGLLIRGHYSEHAPFALLSELPFYANLIVPSRFLVLCTLALAVAGAIALDTAIRVVHRRVLVAILIIAAALAVYDPLQGTHALHTLWATDAFLPRPDPKVASHYSLVADGIYRLAEIPERNVGLVSCSRLWGPLDATGFALGDVPQASVEPRDAGHLDEISIRQNDTTLAATMTRDGTLRLNQTFDADWHTEVGSLRRGATGLLELTLPKGVHRVKLRYWPKGLLVGVIGSFLGVGLVIYLFIRQRALRAHREVS
ncbi:MAG: hypothetical protein NVS3B20_01240 [Polyangiales bacterium]